MNTQTIFGAQFVLSLVAFGIVAELRGSGVTATVLSPTFTRSPAASSPRTTSTSTGSHGGRSLESRRSGHEQRRTRPSHRHRKPRGIGVTRKAGRSPRRPAIGNDSDLVNDAIRGKRIAEGLLVGAGWVTAPRSYGFVEKRSLGASWQ